MSEIRTIESYEADEFLTLLCDVFDLNFARAHSIFFNEPLFDLSRKWGLWQEGRLVSILTTTPLVFGWGKAMGIAGVATMPERRGQGLAANLIEEALARGREMGEEAAFLFAKSSALYERLGFRVLDRVVRAPLKIGGDTLGVDPMPILEVQSLYDEWALKDPNRLRRDDRRWNYWKWNFKACSPFGGGYLCSEGSLVRECIVSAPQPSWPCAPGSHWLGLAGMAQQMAAPVGHGQVELMLMGRSSPGVPQMFMTDQF